MTQRYRFINLFCPRYTEGLLPRAASAYVRLALHVDVQLRRVSHGRLGARPSWPEDTVAKRERGLSLGRPGRGDPPETFAPGRASHASLASTPRASSGRVDRPVAVVGAVLFPPGDRWISVTRRLPAGQGATAGGRHSIAPGIAVFQPAASLFMDFIGHFSLSLPSVPPPSIRPATTACPPSPTCTCWCCTTTRCVPLVCLPQMGPFYTRKPSEPTKASSSHSRPGSEAATQAALTCGGPKARAPRTFRRHLFLTCVLVLPNRRPCTRRASTCRDRERPDPLQHRPERGLVGPQVQRGAHLRQHR